MTPSKPVRRKMQSSTQSVSIPDKLYFRIGDVSTLCDVPAYVLRFWETEFAQLKPNKGGTGQRLYRKRDVEMVLEIKRLLYEDGFTIAGARRSLLERRRAMAASEPVAEENRAPKAKKSKGRSGPALDSPKNATRNERKPISVSADKSTGSEPKTAERPKIKDLRQEMRDILNLLGSDAGTKSSNVTAELAKKKVRRTDDEPTLFE